MQSENAINVRRGISHILVCFITIVVLLAILSSATVAVAAPLAAEAGPDRTIAPGGSTTLAGSASGGLSPYTYSWSPATGLSNPNIARPTASPATTTTYTLTVTDSLSQVSTDTVLVTVTVRANAGPDKTIALGGSCTLGGSAAGGTPPYTYTWTPTTGLSDPNIAQPTASPATTTTYTLTVTDSLSQVSTDTILVTVTLRANAGPNRTIALGGSCILEGSASGGAPPYTYSWTPTTGLSDPSIAQPTASPTTTTTYTLTVRDSLSRVSTDTAVVTVASAVVANAGPDRTIAPGGSTTLAGSASGGLSPYTYSWSPATGLSDPNVAQPTASPTVTTTYTLTVCDSLSQVNRDTTVVTVADLPPTAAFSYAPSSPTTADTVAFADSSSDADGTIVAWSWDFGDGTTSTQRNPTHQYGDDGTYLVTLVVTDNDGAPSAPYSASITVADVAPTAAFIYAPASPVVGEAVNFTDASSDPDGTVVAWSWDFGDGATSTQRNPTHQYGDNGTYLVTLVVTDNDGTPSAPYSASITVADVAPTAAFTYAPASPTVGQTVSFTDTSTDPDGTIVAWSWDFGDGATSTQRNPTHQYGDEGTYLVTLVVTDDEGTAGSHSAVIAVEVLPMAYDETSGEDSLVLAYDGQRVVQAGESLLLSASAYSVFPGNVAPGVGSLLTFTVVDHDQSLGAETPATGAGPASRGYAELTLAPGVYRVCVWFPGGCNYAPATAGPEIVVVRPPDENAVATWGTLDGGTKQFALLAAPGAGGPEALSQFEYVDAESGSEVTSTSVDSFTAGDGVWQLTGLCEVDGVHGHRFEVQLAQRDGDWFFTMQVSNGLFVQGVLDSRGYTL